MLHCLLVTEGIFSFDAPNTELTESNPQVYVVNIVTAILWMINTHCPFVRHRYDRIRHVVATFHTVKYINGSINL